MTTSRLAFSALAAGLALLATSTTSASPPGPDPIARVARLDLPGIDLDAVRAEDDDRAAAGLPPRYAVPQPVAIHPLADGTWDWLNADTLRWRLLVRSPGAASINLGFGRFRLPEGGRLTLYSADGRPAMRPFTAADNEAHGELWTPVVRGESVLIEVTVPADRAERLELELTSVNHGYRGFGAPEPAKSGSCNVDVICSQGDGWRDQIRSVAVISLGGGTFCSGFAVNNTANDGKPYFMTARHCGINAGNAASLVAVWNYENSTCRPPGSPASGGPGDGSLAQFSTGSIFRASATFSDFTLVELDDPLDPTFAVFLAGWDATAADATSAVAIHHPSTDEKRISFEDQATTTTSYLGSAVPGNGSHVRITDWDQGTTEGGSSGSPLFNQDQRVIGQLHGGFALCGNDDSDWYGRFDRSFSSGATPDARLSDWLDPGATGQTAIDGMDAATPIFEDDFESGDTSAWTLTFP